MLKPMLIDEVIKKYTPIPENVRVEFGGKKLFKITKRGDMAGYWAITSNRTSNGRLIDKIHLNDGVMLIVDVPVSQG